MEAQHANECKFLDGKLSWGRQSSLNFAKLPQFRCKALCHLLPFANRVQFQLIALLLLLLMNVDNIYRLQAATQNLPHQHRLS